MAKAPRKRKPHKILSVPLAQIGSVALRRIVEEVRAEKLPSAPTGYNRTYSRHNRGA